jgi:hypothetical protein
MEEYEERTPDADGRAKVREVSGRLETTDLLLRELHSYLRKGRALEAQTSEQRVAVARVRRRWKTTQTIFTLPIPASEATP